MSRVPPSRDLNKELRRASLRHMTTLGELMVMSKALDIACEYIKEREGGEVKELKDQFWQEASTLLNTVPEDMS